MCPFTPTSANGRCCSSGGFCMSTFALAVVFLAVSADSNAAAVEKGTATFQPLGDQKDIPERYRLSGHKFDWEMAHKFDLKASGVEVWAVRFPSPVVTK